MGRVGTGYPAHVASDLLKRMNPLRRKTAPFANPPRGRDYLWIEPKLVGEIEFENITRDRIFRQPSFKGLRLDKDATQVVIERPQNPASPEKEAVMQLKQGTSSASRGTRAPAKEPKVCGIRITHPEKVFWPATKSTDAVTKLDLAQYLDKVAERMLEHVAERPISVVRAPDGLEGERFFQRHKLMGTAVPLLALPVRGEAQPYLGINDAEGLVALAQAGVIEIHPWGSKPGDPDVPERIILDLDPGEGVSFDKVIDAARELRERLQDLGFVPFVKTTGGKGIHVVIAIKGKAKNTPTWSDAKAFARAIAFQMAKDSPDAYTESMPKKQRVGKIFIDYLRNDRTSTGVAPWSPRLRPGATIAVPLKWTQVKRGLDPAAFTIASASSVLRRADPWADLAASARPLESVNPKSRRRR